MRNTEAESHQKLQEKVIDYKTCQKLEKNIYQLYFCICLYLYKVLYVPCKTFHQFPIFHKYGSHLGQDQSSGAGQNT